ncbi:hypothetical protein [Umezawaea sp. Da 62-37]|uniref:hypothetical protein n=1 Tax=Umezawaea sp. Da 62-37 TaxID=3075927 RepID=UPI0028F717AC|nr:hypothetical protein [Umezawaea sp. Da 62-37]WNV85159.1 hypothetical protein RM788_44670 [Umezawaea sp. Da 62-37]
MPADLARHLGCLAGSSAITEGWTVDSVSRGSRSYPIDVHTLVKPGFSSGKEVGFDP